MIILTTFLTIGFVSTSIGLCWLSDKYSELQKQIEENRRSYKDALQTHKKRTKRD